MAHYNVKVHIDGKTKTYQAEEGVNLLRFLRDNSISISSPCGGKGNAENAVSELKA